MILQGKLMILQQTNGGFKCNCAGGEARALRGSAAGAETGERSDELCIRNDELCMTYDFGATRRRRPGLGRRGMRCSLGAFFY